MIESLNIEILDKNESAHTINEDFREREYFERKIKNLGIDLHEEEVEIAVLRNMFDTGY